MAAGGGATARAQEPSARRAYPARRVPLFCRHNRFEASCPICSKEKAPAPRARPSKSRARASAQRRPQGGLVTKRLARATDDGYRSALAPGLKATADAERLAQALAIAAEALEQREPLTPAQAAEQAFGNAAAIEGWNPPAGDPNWSPQRRFERWYDRLRLPGTTRAQRFAFLVALGPAEGLEAGALFFDVKADDPATLAAKRLLNSGDALLLERRAKGLADAAGVPLAALDRGLVLWGGTDPLPSPPHPGVLAALRL
jgi:hypothetical protein